MTEVTEAAIDVATEAIHCEGTAGSRTCSCQSADEHDQALADDRVAAIRGLAAAAPLIVSHRETATAAAIAKAERERIRQLAIESDAKYVFRIDFPDNELRPFADLLTEG